MPDIGEGEAGRTVLVRMEVRLLLVLPASEEGRAGEPRYGGIRGERIIDVSRPSSSVSRRYGRRSGVDGRLTDSVERKDERLSDEKTESVRDSVSSASRLASAALLTAASRSISLATDALISGVTQTQVKVRSCVTHPPRISHARMSM